MLVVKSPRGKKNHIANIRVIGGSLYTLCGYPVTLNWTERNAGELCKICRQQVPVLNYYGIGRYGFSIVEVDTNA